MSDLNFSLMRACANCGNYFILTDDLPEEIYCSDACREIYTKCSCCGVYFKSDYINHETEELKFCSEKCKDEFNINVIQEVKK